MSTSTARFLDFAEQESPGTRGHLDESLSFWCRGQPSLNSRLAARPTRDRPTRVRALPTAPGMILSPRKPTDDNTNS